MRKIVYIYGPHNDLESRKLQVRLIRSLGRYCDVIKCDIEGDPRFKDPPESYPIIEYNGIEYSCKDLIKVIYKEERFHHGN